MADKKTCFVIMGFGKKTAYGTSTRTLDLDATYEAIIQPAVTDCDLICIRADKITHSGVIDKPMYEMLLRADLVIADISTANANAIYELGVRHALRPRSTIIIKEEDGAFHFDLNHLATLQYKHMGDDIGTREAKAKRDALATLIRGVLAKGDTDSPVFTYLTELQEQPLGKRQFQQQLTAAEAQSNDFGQVLTAARAAAKDSKHAQAKKYFAQARELMEQQKGEGQAPDPFIIQQLALATYKDKSADPGQALEEAWNILSVLSPATSTDPETLGIAGAIQKRLWERRNDVQCLNQSIELYGRGFEVRRDYYNGENYALCLDLRAQRQADPDEAAYDRKTALKVRYRIIDSLKPTLAEPAASDRSDYNWMLATMANTLHALGRSPEAEPYEQKFRRLPPADWELATFEVGKKYALDLCVASKPSK